MSAGGRVEGFIWWCGDPVCDCTRPQIIRWIAPTRSGEPGSYGWHQELLWEGTFVSQYGGGDDRSMQMPELREAAARFGLVEREAGFYVEPGRAESVTGEATE